jgi:hypothetical protein
MDEIKNIIHGIIGKLSTHQPSRDQALLEIWERCLDRNELDHSKVAGIKNDSLTVHVDSSVWLYQIKLKQKQILQRLQKEFPEIQRIYFKIGSLK